MGELKFGQNEKFQKLPLFYECVHYFGCRTAMHADNSYKKTTHFASVLHVILFMNETYRNKLYPILCFLCTLWGKN